MHTASRPIFQQIFHPGGRVDIWVSLFLSNMLKAGRVSSYNCLLLLPMSRQAQEFSSHNTDFILPFQCSQVGIRSYWLAQCIIWTEEGICFSSASMIFFCTSAFVSLAQTIPRHFLNNGMHLTSCQGNRRRINNGRGYSCRFNDSSLSPLCRKKTQ